MVPLYDMSVPFDDGSLFSSVLAVKALSSEDRRHSLGVPGFVSEQVAINAATQRGWHVVGIWRPKNWRR